MLLRNTDTRHDQNLSQGVQAENKAPSLLVGCKRCQAMEDLGRYCHQDVHKRALCCFLEFYAAQTDSRLPDPYRCDRQVTPKRRYAIPILRSVKSPKMPRSRFISRRKPEITQSTEISEFIRLSISITFVMTLVPACIKIQGNSDTSRGKGKGESYLYLIHHHATNTYRRKEVELHQMATCGLLHAPAALFREASTLQPLGTRLSRPQEYVLAAAKGITSALLGISA